MYKSLDLRVPPETAARDEKFRAHVARTLGIDASALAGLRIRRRSIDARQRQVMVNLTVDVFTGADRPAEAPEPIRYPDVSRAKAAIVVGAGPAGLFAALRLIESGRRPIVLERGKDVRERKKDLALIARTHTVDAESNYAFGEGGAGAYSDGKLYTRSKKRGNVERILRIFCQFGASPEIMVDAHPHIGTDRLPRIIENMREAIRASGGEVHFGTRADRLLIDASGACRGVASADGREFQGPVVLATGHSARDVYRHLHASGLAIEPKGLAVGVRLEHPSALIDRIMYHSREGRGRYLPAAEYAMTAQIEGRGVYSFCMCPGGSVVPAASGAEQLVVNGMSPSHRGGAWSNSGMVVETRVEDFAAHFKTYAEQYLPHLADFPADSPLCMMHLQEALERACHLQAHGRQTAPAQRMTDFVAGRLAADLPQSSYAPGLIASPLHFWLPPFVAGRLRQAFTLFGRRYRGFLTSEAAVIAAETRTSAPVRIVREPSTLRHVHTPGLYPAGEGAGYAGGIVSAAIDGERAAEALAAQD